LQLNLTPACRPPLSFPRRGAGGEDLKGEGFGNGALSYGYQKSHPYGVGWVKIFRVVPTKG